jgi:hypothetical protein
VSLLTSELDVDEGELHVPAALFSGLKEYEVMRAAVFVYRLWR